MLLGVMIVVGLWLGVDRSKSPPEGQTGVSVEAGGWISKVGTEQTGGKNGAVEMGLMK
jgi:hypothetical protein